MEHLVGGDFAEDVGEVVDAFAGVLAEEVGRGAVGEALADAGDAIEGVGDGLEVAGVGDGHFVAAEVEVRGASG